MGLDNPQGERIRYTLDDAGRTIRTETFDATNVLATQSSTVYDGLGRVKQSISAENKVTRFSYDEAGNVTQVEDPLGKVTQTAYDALNRPILITDPMRGRVDFDYNPHDEVTEVGDPNNNATRYTYSGLGDRTPRTLGRGTRWRSEMDRS